jgi:hypothetical protein
VIDPRLQSLLDNSAATAAEDDEYVTSPTGDTTTEAKTPAVPGSTAAIAPVTPAGTRCELINLATAENPALAPIAEAARGGVRMGSGGRVVASPTLRDAMRALVPGRDKAPPGSQRLIGSWLTADANTTTALTETSPYFTVSHWHWLAARELVRRLPADLGPTFPHLLTSETQVVHDLQQWGALTGDCTITDEAAAMFGAVTGHAELTMYGTVLLYAQRRAPKKLPAELVKLGLQAAVRDVPRVTFAVGIAEREVVTALVNNSTVIFTRRLRRGSATCDAATAIGELLDPEGNWPPYPLRAPIVLPGEVVDKLATGAETADLIDTEPRGDATDEERVSDIERREKVRKGVRKVLSAARTPTRASEAIAEIAASTTHALAQITVRTSTVDVSRAAPGALALVFLRGRGVVASYPSGSSRLRRITYMPGNSDGIEKAITTLRNAYRGS